MVQTFPLYPHKYGEQAVVEPHTYLEYLTAVGRGPDIPAPQAAILCYQTTLLERLRARHGIRRVRGALRDYLYACPERGDLVVAGGFGIGAPMAAAVMEELIALGCRRFVSIGTAGCLRADLAVGDLVVCDRALRDEGTSYHYLPPAVWAEPSAELTAALVAALERRGAAPRLGGAWTTDAVYRETWAEVLRYRRLGVAVVEMEAAALFAVAACRGVQAAAALTVSDSLTEPAWRPEFQSGEVGDALELLFAAAGEALLAAPPDAGGEPAET